MSSTILATIPEDTMDGDIDIFSDLINLDGIPSSYSTIPESILETELASQFDSVDEPPDTTTTNITRDSPTPKNEGTVTTSNVDEVPGSLESPPLNASVSGEDRSLAQQERKRRRRPSSPEPNYQQQVAKHNSKRKRTGQACDRCRVCRFSTFLIMFHQLIVVSELNVMIPGLVPPLQMRLPCQRLSSMRHSQRTMPRYRQRHRRDFRARCCWPYGS